MPYSTNPYMQRVWSPSRRKECVVTALKSTFVVLAILGSFSLGRYSTSMGEMMRGNQAALLRRHDFRALQPLDVEVAAEEQLASTTSEETVEHNHEAAVSHAAGEGSDVASPPATANEERQVAVAVEKPDPPTPYVPVVVPRDPVWFPLQRLIPGEKDITSHVYEEARHSSMNPPVPLEEMATSDHELQELNSRIILGIGMGIHSGHTNIEAKGMDSLPLYGVLFKTFFPVAGPNFIYRFYLAFDHNDPVYEQESIRAQILQDFAKALAEEDGRRWHPQGYIPGVTIDASTLIASVHFVHCGYSGKPSWAHNDAIMAAYKEGADYAYRTNDDTAFPPYGDWADKLVADLRQRDIPNLGVVGPFCQAGPTWILTHDFTHKTHVTIFGYEYPRSLPDWSSDDWVSDIYKQFGLMSQRHDVVAEHKLHAQRYREQARPGRLRTLNAEIASAAKVIQQWALEKHGKSLTYDLIVVECC